MSGPDGQVPESAFTPTARGQTTRSGAFCFLDDKKTIIWQAEFIDSNSKICAVPGQIIDINQFYSVLYNEIAWQTLISKLYYRVTSVSQSEIEELINKNPDISLKLAEQIIMDKQLSLKSSKMLRDLRAEATIEYR